MARKKFIRMYNQRGKKFYVCGLREGEKSQLFFQSTEYYDVPLYMRAKCWRKQKEKKLNKKVLFFPLCV